MTEAEREAVRAVLTNLGVTGRRATSVDTTEEIILVSGEEYVGLNVRGATELLMSVLPHRKVWVAPDGAMWRSEPL
jgi:hypothetical protein